MRELLIENKNGELFLVEKENENIIKTKINLDNNFKINITGKEYLTILNLLKKGKNNV